jgi:hypothetical protein
MPKNNIRPTPAAQIIMNIPRMASGGGSGEGDVTQQQLSSAVSTHNFAPSSHSDIRNSVSVKQDALVSGTNIKTINGESILGSGDIEIASASDVTNDIDDIKAVIPTTASATNKLVDEDSMNSALEDMTAITAALVAQIGTGGGNFFPDVWQIPKPDEAVVGDYFIAVAYGTLGEDEASSDVEFGYLTTIAALTSATVPRAVTLRQNPALSTPSRTISQEAVVGVWFGSLFTATTLGDGFLNNCTAFNQPLEIPEGVTSIGLTFLNGCRSFNSVVTLPDSLEIIGNNFMQNCTAYNKPFRFPNNLTSVGSNFMMTCVRFNQPITTPVSLTTTPTTFLTGCNSFDSVVTIPEGTTNIGSSFLVNCISYNQPLTIPDTVTQIGTAFLQGCIAFNKEFIIPSSVTNIGSNFLTGCASYSQPITFHENLTTVGAILLSECRNYRSVVTWNASVYPNVGTGASFGTASTLTSIPIRNPGIGIAGTNAVEFRAAVPNRTATPFRVTRLV